MQEENKVIETVNGHINDLRRRSKFQIQSLIIQLTNSLQDIETGEELNAKSLVKSCRDLEETMTEIDTLTRISKL